MFDLNIKIQKPRTQFCTLLEIFGNVNGHYLKGRNNEALGIISLSMRLIGKCGSAVSEEMIDNDSLEV